MHSQLHHVSAVPQNIQEAAFLRLHDASPAVYAWWDPHHGKRRSGSHECATVVIACPT